MATGRPSVIGLEHAYIRRQWYPCTAPGTQTLNKLGQVYTLALSDCVLRRSPRVTAHQPAAGCCSYSRSDFGCLPPRAVQVGETAVAVETAAAIALVIPLICTVNNSLKAPQESWTRPPRLLCSAAGRAGCTSCMMRSSYVGMSAYVCVHAV